MFTKKTPKTPKNAKSFNCEKCNFICSKQSEFIRHCSTRKHQEFTKFTNEFTEKRAQHICSQCNKNYTSRMGLWKHAQKCNFPPKAKPFPENTNDISNEEPIRNYIVKLVEQNVQLSQQNTELNKKIDMLIEQPTHITNNIHNKTIHNQFNLNVFLQEKCKDALNMREFIDTLQINTDSVEYTGTHGYVNGITKIFMDGLNQLEIHERHIHCTDLKRETLYIKEENKWEKDTENNTRFKQALDTVVNRNMAQVRHWEDENPRCKIPETDEYEFYFVIARQSLGGGDHAVTARNNDRILRAIAGHVYLDKKMKELQ